MSKNKLPWICVVVFLMLVSIGLTREREQSPDAARARAERSMRDALKVMRDADKLTDKQVDELYYIVFPKDIDWDARYEAFLKDNPGVAKAVTSGRIAKEKVIAGIKSREGERPPTEEEQLEALYQKLLKDEPTLGRTPKAELMPRLKAMLERGEGKNLRPEKSTRQRMMSFGLYFNGLIESGQVERFDKDMQKVYDVGEAEINRQGQQKERGQAADQARGGRGARDNQRQRDDDLMRGVRLRLRSKMEALLPPLGEHIGRHCGLDEAAVETLRAAVFESVNTMLEQDGARARGLEYLLADDLTLVETMLSEPAWRGTFAKCLSEKQLQDYTRFTNKRRQLDQQAVRKQVVAWLGRSLSLTANQRVQVERAIRVAGEESEVRISSLAWTDANLRWDVMDATSGFISPLPDVQLDGILTSAQAWVWALMSAQGNEQGNRAGQEGRGNNRRDEDPRLARYRAAEAELNRAVEAGRMTREQANERLIGLRQRLWADDVAARQDNDTPESEDRVRQLAEAQLAAHTEQLGQLDARAAKRLELAAKGAVEQVLESQGTGRRADPTNARDADIEWAAIRIREAAAMGRITREQAAERLGAMRQRGSGIRQQNAPVDITSHSLYQQTIKDVLSAEAYARYQARQAESLAFRQQAARDVVVAGLDLQLWLGEKQRKHFEQAAAKLFAPPADATVSAPAEMVAGLFEHFSGTERQVLSSWQARQFEAIRTGRNRRER